MTYTVLFSQSSKKDFDRLDKNLQKRAIAVLERIRVRPEDFVTKLVGYPAYKLRVGDYRIILDIEMDKLLILKIGHSKSIYKGL